MKSSSGLVALVLAAVLFSGLSAVADDRTSVSYNSNGGVRNGQEAADNGWKFLGFDFGGLFKDRAPEPMQDGTKSPGYAPESKPELVKPIVSDHRSTPTPVETITFNGPPLVSHEKQARCYMNDPACTWKNIDLFLVPGQKNLFTDGKGSYFDGGGISNGQAWYIRRK